MTTLVSDSQRGSGDLQVRLTNCFLQSAHSNRGAGVKAARTKEKFHGVTELLRRLDGAIELRLRERCLGQRG